MDDYVYVEERDGRPVVKDQEGGYVNILSIFHDFFDTENYSTTMSEQEIAEKYDLNINQAFEAIQFCQSDGNFEMLQEMCEKETADLSKVSGNESGKRVRTKYTVEGGGAVQLEEFTEDVMAVESAFEQLIFDESTPVTYQNLRRNGDAITLEVPLENGLQAEIVGGEDEEGFYLGYRTEMDDASVKCEDEEMIEPVLDLFLGDLYELSDGKGLEREM